MLSKGPNWHTSHEGKSSHFFMTSHTVNLMAIPLVPTDAHRYPVGPNGTVAHLRQAFDSPSWASLMPPPLPEVAILYSCAMTLEKNYRDCQIKLILFQWLIAIADSWIKTLCGCPGCPFASTLATSAADTAAPAVLHSDGSGRYPRPEVATLWVTCALRRVQPTPDFPASCSRLRAHTQSQQSLVCQCHLVVFHDFSFVSSLVSLHSCSHCILS